MSQLLADMDLYSRFLNGWAQMYIDGLWTLEKFEEIADMSRKHMFGSPRPTR